MARSYSLVATEDEDGRFNVHCPEIPGVISQGDTLKEAFKNGSAAFAEWSDYEIARLIDCMFPPKSNNNNA